MVRIKTIKIKQKGGGFRHQKVKVLASGKLRFVKNSTKKLRARSTPRKKQKVKTMAKRRKYYRKKKGSSNGILSGIGRYVAPVTYGAFRQKVSDMINSTAIAKSFPASNYTDEALMFGALILASRLGVGKSGILRSVISHGKTIELARIGETLSRQGLGLKGNTANNGGLFSGGGY